MVGYKGKIVHLCLGNFFIDGYSYQENILPKYHVKLGFEVTVIASMVSFDEHGKFCLLSNCGEYFDSNGFKIVRLPYKRGLAYKLNKLFRYYEGTYECLEREKPDIIFIHNTTFGDAKEVVKYIKRHKNVKVYADSHVDWINSGHNFLSRQILHKIIWRHYTKLLLPYCKKVYGVLPIRCEYLNKVYKVPAEKIEYLPIGVDDDSIPTKETRMTVRAEIRKNLKINDTDFVIATGGKIDRFKHTLELMRVINKLKEARLHLLIFGTILPELENEFNGLLSDNIHYVGWCNATQVTKYLLASDLACFPGTHSTLWEQSIGLSIPCIFRKWHGMEHVNVNGNCIYLEHSDEDEIKDAIMRILDKDFYKRLLLNAQNASKKFLYSDIAKQSIELK